VKHEHHFESNAYTNIMFFSPMEPEIQNSDYFLFGREKSVIFYKILQQIFCSVRKQHITCSPKNLIIVPIPLLNNNSKYKFLIKLK
jgi:hypothetical protein